jgi:hypothetical protein
LSLAPTRSGAQRLWSWPSFWRCSRRLETEPRRGCNRPGVEWLFNKWLGCHPGDVYNPPRVYCLRPAIDA